MEKKLFIDQGARLGTVNRDDAVRVGEEFWRVDELPEHRALEDIQGKKKKKRAQSKVNSLRGSAQQKLKDNAKAKEQN